MLGKDKEQEYTTENVADAADCTAAIYRHSIYNS
jgi:hypothetical protein